MRYFCFPYNCLLLVWVDHSRIIMGPHPKGFFCFVVLHMQKYKVYLELVFYMEEKYWGFKSVKHTKINLFLRWNQTGNYCEEFFILLHIFLKGFFIDKGKYIINSISQPYVICCIGTVLTYNNSIKDGMCNCSELQVTFPQRFVWERNNSRLVLYRLPLESQKH